MDLPFTNIRQVLSLHNKVSPEKIFLTVISDQGREELSYGEFSARAHQTANFLQEDLQIKPGDVVTIFDDQPANEAVLLMACWLVGAIAAYVVTSQDDESGRVKARFLRFQYDPAYESFRDIEEDEYYNGKPLIQLGGVPTEGYPHFDTLVRSMPNSFFNDYPEPTLDTPAFQSANRDINSVIIVTQGELLNNAEGLANSQAITGNQRLITCLSISNYQAPPFLASDATSIFVAMLLVGGSLVVNTQFIPHMQPSFWRVIAAERLHIACLTIDQITTLTAFAREQKALGKPIYGTGIYQQDIQQLRHIYCPDAKGHDDLIQQFTAMFPFLVITSP
jgi:hypothetical protein